MLEANTAAFRAGFNFGETAELFDHPYEIKPAQLAAGHVPQHHRQRRPVVRARRRRAAGEAADLLRVVPDHAGVRHPARAVEAEELRREDAAGRRRDRGRGRRGRRRVRGQPRRSPRRAVRVSTSSRRRSGSRSASSSRWCSSTCSAAVRPPGLPTKTEQADLHARDVRPARRGAAADRRRAVAGRLLRRRVRSGAHRAEVPHAGDPAHRRLPRQRGRAVEPARPRRAARHLGAVRDRAQPRRRVLAVPARSRDAGPSVGGPGHAGV